MFINVALSKCIYFTFGLKKHHFMSLRATKLCCIFSYSQYAEVHASAAWWSAQCKGNLPSWPTKQTEREGKNHQQPEIGDGTIRKKVQNLRIQGAAIFPPYCSLHTGLQTVRTLSLSVCRLRLISYRRQQKCTSRTNARFSRNWRLGSKGCRKSWRTGGA